MSDETRTGLIALLTALGGAGAWKAVADFLIKRREGVSDEATELRTWLTAELRDKDARIDKLEHDLGEMRGQYWSLMGTHNTVVIERDGLKARVQVLELRVAELERHDARRGRAQEGGE